MSSWVGAGLARCCYHGGVYGSTGRGGKAVNARRTPHRAPTGALLLLAGLGFRPATAGGPCPADLFREYDPTRPPAILTAPPVRQITGTPYDDPDAMPAGTRSVFYKVHLQ